MNKPPTDAGHVADMLAIEVLSVSYDKLKAEHLKLKEELGMARAHLGAIYYRLKFGGPIDQATIAAVIGECEVAIPRLKDRK